MTFVQYVSDTQIDWSIPILLTVIGVDIVRPGHPVVLGAFARSSRRLLEMLTKVFLLDKPCLSIILFLSERFSCERDAALFVGNDHFYAWLLETPCPSFMYFSLFDGASASRRSVPDPSHEQYLNVLRGRLVAIKLWPVSGVG